MVLDDTLKRSHPKTGSSSSRSVPFPKKKSRHEPTYRPFHPAQVGIAITQFYSLCHLFLKLSILLQYVRVSVMPLDRRLCHILIALLCTGYTIFIVLRMVRCVPFASQWTPKMPGAKCFFNATWFMFASQAWNMVMDFVILVVPVLVLRHSKAPWLQRVLIGVVLAFGASSVVPTPCLDAMCADSDLCRACIISAVRLQTLYPSTTSKDPSWDKIPSAIYGIIEVNVGIACASVVTLRPLYRHLRDAATKGKQGEPAKVSDLDAPGRRVPVDRDELALMTGETTQIGSNADREVELGEGVQKGRNSESSVGDKSMSSAESRTVASEGSGRNAEKERGEGSG
jgi:hypothetical protein